jgi:hypothetical protein
MTDNSEHPEETDNSEHPEEEGSVMPGCGLGLYTGLLGFICLLGLAGIAVSTFGLLQGGSLTSAEIQAGHEVQVYQLSALRRSGLVEVNEIPAVFHDESPTLDGSTVCVMMHDRLIRVESQSSERGWGCKSAEGPVQGWTMAYEQIETIESTGDHFTDSVVIVNGLDAEGEALEIRCNFGPEEGGIRVKRQLQSEAGLPTDY